VEVVVAAAAAEAEAEVAAEAAAPVVVVTVVVVVVVVVVVAVVVVFSCTPCQLNKTILFYPSICLTLPSFSSSPHIQGIIPRRIMDIQYLIFIIHPPQVHINELDDDFPTRSRCQTYGTE